MNGRFIWVRARFANVLAAPNRMLLLLSPAKLKRSSKNATFKYALGKAPEGDVTSGEITCENGRPVFKLEIILEDASLVAA